MCEVTGNVFHRNAAEIEDLAPTQDRWDNLVFFRGGQDENGVGRRFLQGLQKSVESRLTEHVDLVNDVDFVPTHLGGKPHLINEVADVVYRVVRRRIQLKDIERGIVQGLAIFRVDGPGQNARAGGFAHTPRTRKEQRLGQVILADGILLRIRNVALTHHCFKGLGTVLAG
jgi:hypothetical protein